MLKTSRTVLFLLGCSLAALPLAAKDYNALPPCDSGFRIYSGGTISGQSYSNAAAQAEQHCKDYWQHPSSYQTERCHVSLGPVYKIQGVDAYDFGCWMCRGSVWGWLNEQTLDVQQAIHRALVDLDWSGGRVVGVNPGERETAQGPRSTYRVIIQKDDLLFGVDVDAETGEVLATQEEAAEAGGGEDQP